ncbi:MAG: hypothetical protein M1389_12725 [Chloroflexi bacterium]|nr:hypothetical protein [Chloroflexota bacterium]MCL5025989.1 hypothetical protein [Chloroflexota bacterium]
MAEMTRRERLMAATSRQRADKLPFFHYWRHSQVGWAERECRNRGMGMNWDRPPYVARLHDVKVIEERALVGGETVFRRTYQTPVGSVYEDEKREPGVGLWHANRSWTDITPWQTTRLIKGPEDYPVVKFIVEHTEYVADYFPIEQAMDWLGDEGVVMDSLPHSPMQMLMIDWIGGNGGKFYFHHADYPDLVDDLYQALVKSRLPLHEIAARSPAPITLCGDNLDGFLVTPKLFEKYFIPVYEQQAQALHRHGKLMAVHMDGRLAVLKDLIARTPVDIIEAFHPMPTGNMPLSEALAAWKDKALWLGFPGGIYELGPRVTKEYAIGLLKEMGSAERLAVTMSTENLVSNENLLALTSVLEKAALPLTPDKIEHIERTVL